MGRILKLHLGISVFKLLFYGFSQLAYAHDTQGTPAMNVIVFPLPENENLTLEMWSACGGSFHVEVDVVIGNETISAGTKDVMEYDFNPYPSERIRIREKFIDIGYANPNTTYIAKHLQTLKERSVIIKSNTTIRWHILTHTQEADVWVTNNTIISLDDEPAAILFGSQQDEAFLLEISFQKGSVTSEAVASGKVLPNSAGRPYIFVHVYNQSISVGGGPVIPLHDNFWESNGSLSLVASASKKIWLGYYYIRSYDSYSSASYNCAATDLLPHIVWGTAFLTMIVLFSIFTCWMRKKLRNRSSDISETPVMTDTTSRTAFQDQRQTPEDEHMYNDVAALPLASSRQVQPYLLSDSNGTSVLTDVTHRTAFQESTQRQGVEEEHIYDTIDTPFVTLSRQDPSKSRMTADVTRRTPFQGNTQYQDAEEEHTYDIVNPSFLAASRQRQPVNHGHFKDTSGTSEMRNITPRIPFLGDTQHQNIEMEDENEYENIDTSFLAASSRGHQR